MSTTVPEASQAPTIAQRTERLAKMTAFQTALKTQIDLERAATEAAMLDEFYGDSGSKSFNARVNGETVAQFTLKETKDAVRVTDEDALLDWVFENAPSEVETITQVRPAFLAALLKRVQGDADTGVFDPETGAEVPGLTYTPGGEVSGFGTSWKKVGRGDSERPGQAVALDSVLTGDLGALLALEGGE